LTGVDINIGAIEAAKENSRFSQCHPQFHYIDAMKFTAKKYDEVITNMPFGCAWAAIRKNREAV
jgi:16S rRNA G1207 methylase RsmC